MSEPDDTIIEPVYVSTGPYPMPETLSHTSMSLFAECPGKWALRYVQHATPDVGEVDTTALDVGNATHRLMDDLSSGRDSTVAAVDGRIPDAIDDSIEARVARLVESRPEWKQIEAQIVASTKAAIDWAVTNPLRDSLDSTEVTVNGTFAGQKMTGKIDAVDVERDSDGVDGVVLVDYKTGKAPSAQVDPDTGEESSMPDSGKLTQLVMYAEMFTQQTGRPVRAVRLAFSKQQRTMEVDLDSPVGEFVKASAESFASGVAVRMLDACESGKFETKPVPWRCARCEFQSRCPSITAV